MAAVAQKLLKKTATRKATPALKAVPKVAVIDETVSPGQQSVSACRVVSVDGKKLRFEIKSDSYDFQSYAHADLWSSIEGKWNRVCAIPYSQMKTPFGLLYRPQGAGISIVHFGDDMHQLQDVALKIVF